MSDTKVFLLILASALATMLTRFLPFIAFGRGKTPRYVSYLGRVLPPAAMTMLVVYCLRNINFMEGARGIPEILSALLVIILHVWKRNTLLSILGGTVAYMVLVQRVF